MYRRKVTNLFAVQHTELQFYGSTILHSKLLKDWADIPATEYEPLKTKLLDAIVFFKDGPKVVLNRLCISVSMVCTCTLLRRLHFMTFCRLFLWVDGSIRTSKYSYVVAERGSRFDNLIPECTDK